MPFERLEFAFECFEPRLKGSNLYLNGSNLVRMVRICIRVFRIPIEWLSLLNGSNLHSNSSNPGSNLDSNASNPFRIVQICIRMLRVPFEWFECTFECFESLSNVLNLDLDVSNPFRIV